ncbi:MAG: M3 family peptidase [Marinilabiliales bacterium]|nr:MAG: M3 family peptidase [Marinilabiliales bacterium]
MITAASSCTVVEENPLLAEFNTPFNLPPFDRIESEHFIPAFDKAMEEHNNEIDAIAGNPEPPTFVNTVAALDYSGYLLSEVQSIFSNLNSSHTNEELQQIAREITPKLSAHSTNILLNAALFERIEAVHNQKDNLGLNPEQAMLLDKTYKRFVRGGAGLDPEKQERLREINQQLSMLTLQFGDNIRDETNSFELVIEDEADLAGLPSDLISNAAEVAAERGHEGKWVFTHHNPSVMPFLSYADNRDLREKMKKTYINRCNNDNEYDNKENIRQIVNLRIERAGMLGYPTHAHYVLEENMAGTPERVSDFLDELWDAALPVAKDEVRELQAMIDSEGGGFTLEPWDWRYYAEKVRKEKFDLDEAETRPYFSMDNVIEGTFMVVEKLWGLRFVKLDDVPTYHDDAEVYQVLEADGSHLGILYMDNYNRPSKRGGAWMSRFRGQSVTDGEFIHPVITINCNFSRPTGGQPSLLTFDEYTTFFHEFGHALHGLMSDVTYPGLAGTSVPRDFVELPSQVMENWARHPEVMTMFARHYETGEVIPQDLIDRITAAGHFNQGFATVEYLATAFIDMDYHTLEQQKELDPISFEDQTTGRIGLIPEIVPRWRSTYLSHIFSGGYSAGYYSYIWSGVLDADAFEAFMETSLFDRETAESFRTNILERGGTMEPMEMYVNFRGREPEIGPLLRQRGLK